MKRIWIAGCVVSKYLFIDGRRISGGFQDGDILSIEDQYFTYEQIVWIFHEAGETTLTGSEILAQWNKMKDAGLRR